MMDNLTDWPFEPICYTPHPLILTGLEGPLPRGCNGPASMVPWSWGGVQGGVLLRLSGVLM